MTVTKMFECLEYVGGLRNKIEPNAKEPKYLHTVTNVGYKLTPFAQD